MAGIFKAYDIRGTYPDELDESIIEKIGKAYADFLNCDKVVVGYDMRTSSSSLFNALTNGLIAQGVDVINIGLCSTPMNYYANGRLDVDGSIMITASHNSKEWNGLKLCKNNAIPLSYISGINDIEGKVNNENWKKNINKKGKLINYDIKSDYNSFIKKFSKINKSLKVVVDFANGMGSYEIEGLKDLIEVIPLYEKLDGTFPNHLANPLKTETLKNLSSKVREVGADFGVALDGDGDRCGFVDNEGQIVSMDFFTALISLDILNQKNNATILYDLRSSKAVREFIEENGGNAIMSRVGHAFIKNQMRETEANFAGELSGHYYFKENYFAESQALAILKICNLICLYDKSLKELILPLNRYYASGEINSKVDTTNQVISNLKEKYSSAKIYELDGLTVEYPEWWFNVRPSNTEPLLRLNLEAETNYKMQKKREEVLKIIRSE